MASEATKSIGGGLFLSACPRAEREPRMHWMEERRRLNDSLHLSQEMVVLYFWSHFSDSMEASLLRQTFVALPHLEYACTVWDPHLAKEITLLENVQKFACKICCKSWLMDYDSMLVYLDIPSLQQRRLQLKANLMYQFVNKDSFIPEGLLLSHPPSNYNMRTISYFTVPYARTNAYYI